MALEGTIRDFGLPDIFQLIGLQRKTGTLTLTNEKDGESVTVTFESGMVVMADSSGNRLEDRLGHVLVKQGKLTRDRLEEALTIQKQTLQRLGHILAGGSAITSRDLRDALQVQVSQIVFRVFRWRDGRYQFTPADSVDYDRDNFSPMSTDFILMEGIRMVDEWPIIEKKITSFDRVFKPVVDRGLIEVASAEEGSGERQGAASGRIRLSPEEERVFRRVDGVRTVQGIIDATGGTEFEVCRTLFDFLNRNLVAPSRHEASRTSGEEQRTETASAVPGFMVAVVIGALALAGLGVQLGSPFAVTGLGPAFGESQQRLLDTVTHARLARLRRAIEAWRANQGVFPETLDVLATAGLVDPSQLLDPWHRPFRYEVGRDGYLLAAVDEGGRSRSDTLPDRRGDR